MIRSNVLPNSELVPYVNLSRSSLYYHPKQPDKDWLLKCQLEEVLHEYPSYGHKRSKQEASVAGDEIVWSSSISSTGQKTV